MNRLNGKLLATTFLSALWLAGCSSSGGDGGGSSDGSTVGGVATTTKNTEQVISQSTQLSSVLVGTRDDAASYKPGAGASLEAHLYAKLGELLDLRPSRQARGAAKLDTYLCNTGSIEVTSPDDPYANPYEISIKYINCDDGYGTANGTVTLSETANLDGSYTYSMIMGDGDTSAETTDYRYDYSDTSGSFSMIMSMEMSGTDSADLSSGTASMNGIMSLSATSTSGTSTASLTANALAVSWSEDVASSTSSSSMNGGLTLLASSPTESYSFTATYTDLTLATYADGSYSIDGGISFSSTPASCGDGSYTFTTLTPISASGTSGKIKINDNTVEYLSDGSILVTTADGSSETYTRAELAQDLCSG